MRTVRLGRTGLRVSEVCLGTMTFGLQTQRDEAFAIMDVAEAAGIDFIDVADVYPVGGTLETVGRTEEIVGDWMAGKSMTLILGIGVCGYLLFGFLGCWTAVRAAERIDRKHTLSVLYNLAEGHKRNAQATDRRQLEDVQNTFRIHRLPLSISSLHLRPAQG